MSTSTAFALLANASCLPWSEVPEWSPSDFVAATAAELSRGGRLCAWFGVPEDGSTRLVAVIAFDADNTLAVGRSSPFRAAYESLTALHPQAHLFEREVYEQHHLRPLGHPWLKPVRHYPEGGPGCMEFFRFSGSEIHEVSVGPVHAGIIEPGHFRFQCDGEEVLHLEIALGYQHRGVEEALTWGLHKNSFSLLETVSGDSSLGHASAAAKLIEALGGTEAPLRAQWLRSLALELERLANHTGDLGAMANDVAFQPTAAACGRIRGDFLNLTALICGNRFGRALVRPGGCLHDLEPARLERLSRGLDKSLAEVEQAATWLWDAPSVRARFEGTGALTTADAASLGLVGPAARACGLLRDIRFDHPSGWYRFSQPPVAVWPDGDVFSRARVRWLEIQRSGEFIREQLASAPSESVLGEQPPLAPHHLAVSLVEGWRGEICHVALTNGEGRFHRYKIVDPSFHNWSGLALALRGQAISDFPLCNKSFNLSYCGFDL